MSASLLIVSTEFPPGPGGIGSHCLSLAQELGRRGWRVTVAAPQDYAPEQEIDDFQRSLTAGESKIALVRLHHWPGALLQGSIWALRLSWQLIRRRPSLLLATGQRAVWLTAVLARLFRLPWTAVGHGTELAGKTGWEARLNRSTFSQADATVWVSRYTAGVGLAAGIEPRRSEVIPNGADSRLFRRFDVREQNAFRESEPLVSEDRCLLLTVGHVDRRKGQDVVIRALPKIAEAIPNVHYLVLGLPKRGQELTTLAQELGVQDRVHILGRRSTDDLLGFLNTCDLFVMASRHTPDGDFEGFGIAVVEAALCGKPAVVSENSGLVEAIEPGITGLAAPPEDANALADRIVEILSDPERCRTLGEAAHRRARAEQTWIRRGEQYHRLMAELVRPSIAPREWSENISSGKVDEISADRVSPESP